MRKFVDDKEYRKANEDLGVLDSEEIRASVIKLQETIKTQTLEDYTNNTKQKDVNWAKDIRAIYEKRKIEYLIHFTKAYNIKDIMKYGLLNVSSRVINQVRPKCNDKKRLEGHNVLSLSISFPNYKNFYSFRMKDDDAWAVLLINPKILETKICRFYYANAAKGYFRKYDKYELMDLEDFESLFAEWGDGKWTRNQLGTPINETTNPQAEISVFEDIEKEYIEKIIVEHGYADDVKEYLKHQYDDMIFDEHEFLYKRLDGRELSYFEQRPDYKSWYRE